MILHSIGHSCLSIKIFKSGSLAELLFLPFLTILLKDEGYKWCILAFLWFREIFTKIWTRFGLDPLYFDVNLVQTLADFLVWLSS